jgi:excisionase family DNA binding protein
MSFMPRLHPDDIQEIIQGLCEKLKPEISLLVDKLYDSKNATTYSIKEACKLLGGMSESTLRSHCQNGKIHAVKMGKSWLIPQDTITNLLKKYNHE